MPGGRWTRDRRVGRIALPVARICWRWPLIWTGVVLVGSRLYPSPWLTARARRARHAAPSHPADERELARAVLPAAPPGVRHRHCSRSRAFRRRRDWLCRSRSSRLPRSVTSRRRSGSPSSIGTALMVVDRRWRLPGAVGAVIVAARAGVGCRRRTAARRRDDRWTRSGWRRSVDEISFSPTSGRSGRGRRTSGLLAALWLAHRTRVRRGTATPEDRALDMGRHGARGAVPDHAAGGCRACGARRAVPVLPRVLDRRPARRDVWHCGDRRSAACAVA